MIKTERVASENLGRDLTFRTYLPPGYRTSELRYPLLLLLHGSAGDETSWDRGLYVLDGSIRAGRIPPMVAIVPASGTSWWVNSSTRVEAAVLEDLIPHADQRFRTLARRGGRAVAGVSMGGYGAVRYALTYPDMFAAAASLSAALYDTQPPPGSSARTTGVFGTPFDPERWSELNYPTTLDRYLRGGAKVPMFVATGDGEWNEPAGWEYNVEFQSVLFFERLSKQGGSPAALRILTGGHDWALWETAFAEALTYMAEHLEGAEPW